MNDIIVGLQYGDEGKGKITHYLINKKHYTHCVRLLLHSQRVQVTKNVLLYTRWVY